MLSLDDLLNTASAVSVGTCSDDGIFKVVKTDSAHFLALDLDLQHILKGFNILGSQRHNFVFLQIAHEFIHTIFAESPMIADLTETEKNLQQMGIFALLILELHESALRLRPEFVSR